MKIISSELIVFKLQTTVDFQRENAGQALFTSTVIMVKITHNINC